MDVMETMELFLEAAVPRVFEFCKLVIFALVIWIVGKKLIKGALMLAERGMERAKLEVSVAQFLVSVFKVLLYAVLLVSIAGTVGIQTTSLITVLGSVGLTVGLALQGSLSNFAGGVLILILKPFRVGDYIVANGQEGSVVAIDIFYTNLLTIDNRSVVLPNGALANGTIINVTKEPVRRVDLVAPVAYASDIQRVKKLLFELASNLEFSFEDEEHPIQVFVDEFANSAIKVGFRFWVKTEDYWTAKWEAGERMKEMFDANGISIPFNQLDVWIKNQEK